jgi:hypothetical protein
VPGLETVGTGLKAVDDVAKVYFGGKFLGRLF